MRVVDRALTALLRHRLALFMKKQARDLWWNVHGPSVKNPPVPSSVRSILFVCLGNICRSPFAGLIASRELASRGGPQIRCASAGIRTTQAARSPVFACDAAAEFGISLREHRPQTLTPELVNEHDMIVVMEVRQLEHVRAAYPDVHDRVFLISLFDPEMRSGYDRYHIADPFSHPRETYDACYRRIHATVSSLVSAVLEARQEPVSP